MKPTVDSNLPILNRDELIDRMMGSVQMAERMLNRFLDASEAECDALESTARMGDVDELISLAHRHKGTAQTLSTPRIAEIAGRLEKRAATDPTSELLGLIDLIRRSHAEVREAFGTGLESNDDPTVGQEAGIQRS